MNARVLTSWSKFRDSFWFVPTLMAGGATAVAFGSVSIDRSLTKSWVENGWVFTGGPEGARAVLSVIAGSMITVAGVVFSITIVALTLASSQFGPRLLRNFMRDTANQVVLGTFTATFLYCLLVLRTIRGVEEKTFVPHMSVTIGVLLAVASLGVLIYFIHHVAVSIQVTHVIRAVSNDLHASIDRLFPEELGSEVSSRNRRDRTELDLSLIDCEGSEVLAKSSGYLQAVDGQRLVEIAREHKCCIRLFYRPGHFVIEDSALCVVFPAPSEIESVSEAVNNAFVLGSVRTTAQDVEFAVSQLVEVALRALSPGINDPFTAVNCIDWLSTALCRVAGRSIPSPYRYDNEGQLRVIAQADSFAGLVETALHQIGQSARPHPMVTIRLLEAIRRIAECVKGPDDMTALKHHGELIWRSSMDGVTDESDRRDVNTHYLMLREVLDKSEVSVNS